MNYEILGTIASIIVLVSFLQSGEKKIRSYNIVGSFLFTAYGILIGAFSVWFLNSVLFFIHIRRLYQLRSKDEK